MTDLTDLGIAAIRDGVAAGTFSAREVANSFIASVEQGRSLNAWLVETPEHALAALDHVVPLAARGTGEQFGLAGDEIGEEAHVVGVIGHHEEVERARELDRLTARRRHFLPAREAIRVARAEAGAERAGVHRK